MMMNTTLEQLRGLKLSGMADGLQEQLTQAGMTGISFEERLALLVDREVHWRSCSMSYWHRGLAEGWIGAP